MASAKRFLILSFLITLCISSHNCRNNELNAGVQKILYTKPSGDVSCRLNSGEYNETNRLRCYFDIQPIFLHVSQAYTKLTWNQFDVTDSFMPECSKRKVVVYVG